MSLFCLENMGKQSVKRQRGELVPVAEALAGQTGPVPAIREASPQAWHHFTLSRVPCPAPTPATGTSTSASTDRTS